MYKCIITPDQYSTEQGYMLVLPCSYYAFTTKNTQTHKTYYCPASKFQHCVSPKSTLFICTNFSCILQIVTLGFSQDAGSLESLLCLCCDVLKNKQTMDNNLWFQNGLSGQVRGGHEVSGVLVKFL